MLIQGKGAHVITQLSLNDLENRYLLVTKLRSESSAIVSEGNLEALNTLIAEVRAGGHRNELRHWSMICLCFYCGSSGS